MSACPKLKWTPEQGQRLRRRRQLQCCLPLPFDPEAISGILSQAEAELEAERNRARDELRKQVATLAVAGAEKIIERSIDKDAHKDILDNITAKL